ncbi:hypothetical protein GOP47_0026445, partial [Adiantum capillus-veneris]
NGQEGGFYRLPISVSRESREAINSLLLFSLRGFLGAWHHGAYRLWFSSVIKFNCPNIRSGTGRLSTLIRDLTATCVS